MQIDCGILDRPARIRNSTKGRTLQGRKCGAQITQTCIHRVSIREKVEIYPEDKLDLTYVSRYIGRSVLYPEIRVYARISIRQNKVLRVSEWIAGVRSYCDPPVDVRRGLGVA